VGGGGFNSRKLTSTGERPNPEGRTQKISGKRAAGRGRTEQWSRPEKA